MARQLLPGLGGPASARQFERWRNALERLSSEEVERARPVLERSLSTADSSDSYGEARRTLLDLASSAEQAAERLRSLADRVTTLQEEWAASRRYTSAGLDALEQDLAVLFEQRPAEAARRWLNELFDAIRARQNEALDRIARAEFAFEQKQRPGVEMIRDLLGAWRDGDAGAVLRLLDALAGAEVAGWEGIIDAAARSRAHRLAAWAALRVLGESELALAHLEAAVALDAFNGPSYADRAAYFIFWGDLERAAPDAQRAIELAPDDPSGYLELGAWAELVGQFEDARELFDRGLERMPIHAVAMIPQRASILDPPGALLLAAGERLLEAGRASDAVESADAAFLAGVRGARAFPDAEAYRVLSQALERVPGRTPREAAQAAVEAGKRYLWNDQPDEAIEQLTRARKLDDTIEETGWLLADALSVKSFPAGTPLPDGDLVERARATWEGWAAKFGPPEGATSWAYLTRAAIADIASIAPGRDRGLGSWEAVIHVERALAHDDTDARRWGFAARHIRACGLPLVALEAAERGYALGPTDTLVQSERLALLANLGRLDEADAAVEELVAAYGEDPWVSGVHAWLAYHQDRAADALEFLEVPLALDPDPGWYHGLRVLCELAVGDVPAALATCRVLRESAQTRGAGSALQKALACAALGDLSAAREALETARADSAAREGDYLAAAAFIAFAAGELTEAEELLAQSFAEAPNQLELDDLVREARLRLRLLDEDGHAARQAVVDRAVDGAASARRRELEVEPLSPERELSDMLARQESGAASELNLQSVALLAIRARRLAYASALLEAAADYERLRSSLFEPEATIALRRVLSIASAERAAQHDVASVVDIQARMKALGLVDVAQAGLSVAGALEAADRIEEACDYLVALLEEDIGDERRQDLHQRLGELCLRRGRLDEAGRSLEAALELARRRGDSSRSAELEARLGIVAFGSEDHGDGSAHLRAALGDWKSAGAFDPEGPLEDDLRGLSRTEDQSGRSGLVSAAVRIALDYLKTMRSH
jgi:tetratricopeptide (TPR) repeat protein